MFAFFVTFVAKIFVLFVDCKAVDMTDGKTVYGVSCSI